MPTSNDRINVLIESTWTVQFKEALCLQPKKKSAPLWHGATLSHEIGINELRPGGTVSGPVMMAVADVAIYVAILGRIGIVPLTVTTSLTINFLRKPSADSRIIAECTLLKVGRTLIVGEVSLYSEGSDDVVAHVVGTYSVPPKRS